MLLYPAEMNIQLVQMFQQGSERRAFGHLGEGIDIFGEALATITELTVRAGNVCVGVVDVAGEEDTCMHLAPVSTHLLAILTAGIEVSDLIGAKDIVHILGEFGLQWSHHGKFLAHEDLCEQFVSASEHHRLLLEVLDMSTLGEELRHIAHLMAGHLGEAFTGSGKDGGAHEHGHIGQVGDEFLHQREVLCAIFLCRHMNLQEGNVYLAEVIIISFGRVADEQFALRVIVFQPIFQGSAYEATSNNSNVDHVYICFIVYLLID